MHTQLNYEISPYDKFIHVVNHLLRDKLRVHIEEQGLLYNDRLEKVYEVPAKEFESILSKLGTFIGGSEPYIMHPQFVLIPQVIQSNKNNVTFMLVICMNIKDTEVKSNIITYFAPYIRQSLSVNITWATSKKGDISYNDVRSIFDETIFPEAYPFIPDLSDFIKRYLASSSNVLVLKGPPGTGKTRLIKYIVQHIAEIRKESPSILYSMDEKVFSDDGFFLQFLTNDYDALVLEDIDFNLKSRKQGNTFMYKLLGGSDGFIKNPSKKMILSTNLSNISDIDDALLRPGRCFSILQTRKLTKDEAKIVAEKLGKITLPEQTDFSLAEIYNG